MPLPVLKLDLLVGRALAGELRGLPALPSGARRLASWAPLSPEDMPTECYAVGGDEWILRRDVGGIRFSGVPDRLVAFLAEGADRGRLRRVIVHDWLPVVYQHWGRQVLHASAVLHVASGAVIACTGPSGAGKSTLGYGLGRRSGWRQLADDTLAFETAHGAIRLVPIPNEVRLRPRSAEHYGERAYSCSPLDWPGAPPALKAIYFLEPHEHRAKAARVSVLGAAEAYTCLLEQAYALTLDTGARNRRLMKDYLTVTRSLPAFRLAYHQAFDVLEETLDLLERHALSCLGTGLLAQAQ